jgi:hypothetical protein
MYKGLSKYISRSKDMESNNKKKPDRSTGLDPKSKSLSCYPLSKKLICCEKCGSKVRFDRMQKHLEKAHGSESNRGVVPKKFNWEPYGQKAPSASTQTKEITCAVCGLYVAPAILHLHQTTPYCMRQLDQPEMLAQ